MTDLRLPEPALTAGLLMEGAQSQQQLAAAALDALREHTRGLDAVVRDEIHRTLLETLADLDTGVARVTARLEAAGRRTYRRAAGFALAMALLGIAAPVSVRWWLPSPARVAALEAQAAQLSARVARLQREGGGVQLLSCGSPPRLCARIDPQSPRYGEHGDVAVLAGP